jgi:hypothetical protein
VVHRLAEHPSAEALRAYGLGRLAPEATAALEEHLAGCETCCELLESAPADAFLDRLRSADTLDNAPTVPPELVDHPRYEVLGLIGQGGMGAVYKAVHRRMQRLVALKVIHPGLLRRPSAVERFQQEVRAAAQLTHPNIVTAYDADQARGLHFLVMEHVEGTGLAELVRGRGPLPPAEACDYARQAALGLQHAHERGMVHRDVKPHNLMLTPDGVVKILDFGLARLPHIPDEAPTGETAPATLTGTGTVMGTADYIAPEQAADPRAADIRADVYALGCTLFHLLTGGPPFPGGGVLDKLDRHADTPLPDLSELRRDVPHDLGAVLARMTAKDPADRYATPAEAAEALAPFCPLDAPRPPASRRRVLLAAVALGLLATGILGAIVLYPRANTPPVVVPPDTPPADPPAAAPAPVNDGAGATGATKPDDGEEAALRFVQQLGGKVRRDEKAAGKPVASVSLISSKTTDADLPRATAFAHLHTLDLTRTQVSDAGLGYLAGLPGLRGLTLTRTGVTDDGMRSVGRMKQLRLLNLEATAVGDAGMAHLAGLDELRGLTLTSTRVTDAGMANVGRLKSLSVLIVNDAAITDEGVKALAGLTGMVNLSFAWNAGVGDEAMKVVGRFAKLRSLNIHCTGVTDPGLGALSGLPVLCTLEMGGLKLTDAGLEALGALPELQILDLSNTDVTDAGLKWVARHPRVATLNLHGAARVTDAGVKHLAALRDLNVLELSGTRVTDAGLRELAGLPSLRYLTLANTDVSDAGIKELLRCPRLSSLNLTGSKRVTGAGVAELRKARPTLSIQR